MLKEDNTMTEKERFLHTLKFKVPDRAPLWEVVEIFTLSWLTG